MMNNSLSLILAVASLLFDDNPERREYCFEDLREQQNRHVVDIGVENMSNSEKMFLLLFIGQIANLYKAAQISIII